MEPITALAIGGGILGGGSILGGIFGKKAADKQKRALDQLRAQAQQEYSKLSAYGLEKGDEILQQFLADRSANIAAYKEPYESMIADFDARYGSLETAYGAGIRDMYSAWESGMGALESRYEAGMQTAYQTAASGRENTIAAIRRATEASIGRATQMQALTGIGGTTFGQGALASLEQEGAMREGVVQEQYASQLSGIQQAMAGGLAQMGAARVRGGTEILGRLAEGQRQLGLGRLTATTGMRENLLNQILGASQQTTATGTAMRENILSRYLGTEQARVASILGIQQQQAAQSGSGWAAASGALGGIASGVGGAFMTAGLLGAFTPAAGAAGGGGGFNVPTSAAGGSVPFLPSFFG